MKWVLIANLYPYEPRMDYFSLGITLLVLMFMIVGTWILYKSAGVVKGELIVYEILCLRCNTKYKSRNKYLVDLRYLIHRVFCRAHTEGSA